MYQSVKRFINDESGSVGIEYGLIGAGIVLAFVAVLAALVAELRHIVRDGDGHAPDVDKAPE